MDELKKEIMEKANMATTHFEKRVGNLLDYSIESLKVVDEMLAEASEFVDDIPEEQIESIMYLLGCYILAVASKSCEGKFYWNEASDQPVFVTGEPDFRVAIMTFDKVRSRLNGNEADNIPFFFEGFEKKVKTAGKGTDVLYV